MTVPRQRPLVPSRSRKVAQGQSVIPQLTDLAPHLTGGLLPVCPAGGTYTLGAVNEPPRCSHADKGHAIR